MPRQPLPGEGEQKVIYVKCRADLADAATATAKRQKLSVSEWVRRLIREELDRDDLRLEVARLQAENATLSAQLKQASDCLEDVATEKGGWAWEEVLSEAREALPPQSDAVIAKPHPFAFRGHPLTCGRDRGDAAHRAYQQAHGGDLGELVRVEGGWVCPVPECDYTQPDRLPPAFITGAISPGWQIAQPGREDPNCVHHKRLNAARFVCNCQRCENAAAKREGREPRQVPEDDWAEDWNQ